MSHGSLARLAAVLAAAGVLVLACVCPAVARQEGERRPGGERVGPTYTPGETDYAPLTSEAPTKADREPYNRWKVHTASAELAVVFVRMEVADADTGEKQVRTGTGMVLRCDGFVLVPPTLVTLRTRRADGTFGTAHTNTKTLTLTFAGGDPDEEGAKVGPPKPQAVFQPRFFEEYRDFTALKANDAHLRGLPMLHPKNIKDGMKVRLVWAVPDPKKPGAAKAMTAEATLAEPFAPNKIKLHHRFAPGGPDNALPRVPMGTVVVDPASGLALGMVTGTDFLTPRADPEGRGFADAVLSDGARTMPADPAGPYATAHSFATFQSVYDTQNAVAVLPDPSARDSGGRPEGDVAAADKAIDGMVYIPGGPVELYDWFRGWLRQEYKLLYGVDVACTPGFWIDRREVTRDEYRQFVVATGHRPLPAGWTKDTLAGGSPLPGGDKPVVGVRPEDAAAYALWRGKRLVTPVEWAKASRLTSLAFVNEHQQSLTDVNRRLHEIDDKEREAFAMKLAELRAKGVRLDANAQFQLDSTAAAAEERRQVVGEFLGRSGFVVFGTAAGGVEGDVSIYGLRDVTSNAPEWLLANIGKQGRDVTSKPLYVPRAAPQLNMRENPAAIGRLGQELSKLVGVNPEYDREFLGVSGMGFRCAR
jgi:hypothetical protein